MRRTMILIVALVLVGAACGDDDTGATQAPVATTAPPATEAPTTTTTSTTTTTVAPTTTTTEAPAPLPQSSVVSPVDGGYKFGTEQGPATSDDLPFDLGSIEVHWFKAGDRLAAVYIGLDLDATGPLCPGNSIFTGAIWEHISNAPSPGADCTGAPTILDSVAGVSGVQTCEGLVSYMTDIPSDLDGDLFGSVEIYDPAGAHKGASGFVTALAADIPEIDPATLSC